jgi:hypothetical protein
MWTKKLDFKPDYFLKFKAFWTYGLEPEPYNSKVTKGSDSAAKQFALFKQKFEIYAVTFPRVSFVHFYAQQARRLSNIIHLKKKHKYFSLWLV